MKRTAHLTRTLTRARRPRSIAGITHVLHQGWYAYLGTIARDGRSFLVRATVDRYEGYDLECALGLIGITRGMGPAMELQRAGGGAFRVQ